MARIRSIHPGLATDEVYMSMSMAAKAAWPLLWTECDDQGAFEWKPVMLKARLMPADNIDFETILEEWERLGAVKRYTHDGRQLGLVRNFTRFQRPKKPKHRYFIPPEFRPFVGPSTIGTELIPPEPPPVPPKSEKSPQRKEEGGSSEPKGSGVALDFSDSEAVKAATFRLAGEIGRRSAPSELMKLGKSWPEIYATLVTAKTKADPGSYIAAICRQKGAGARPAIQPMGPAGG